MKTASILINNYNYSEYLTFCIESVLNQSYKNSEIILYDDGSTDNSLEIAQKYSNRIKIISRPNYGKHPSFNQLNAIYQAFKISTGEIICLLDSDDAFQPNKIERIVDAFDKNPDAILAQHKSLEINNVNNLTGKTRGEVLTGINHYQFVKETGCLENLFVQTSALSFRRNYLEQIFPLQEDEDFKTIWADVKLSRRAMFFGEILTLNEYLGLYRTHEKNDSHKLKNKEYLKYVIKVIYKYFNLINENDLNKQLHPAFDILHKSIKGFRIIISLLKSNSKLLYNIRHLMESKR